MKLEYRIKDLGFFLIAIGVTIFDLISKALILKHFKVPHPYSQSLSVIGNFLRLTFVKNYGITFGLLHSIDHKYMPVVLVILACLALLMVLYFYGNIQRYLKDGAPQVWGRVALMFIIGGALGNIINRIQNGWVVDFIDVGIGKLRWYTFNIADSFIVVGTLILVFLFIWFEKQEKNTDKSESE